MQSYLQNEGPILITPCPVHVKGFSIYQPVHMRIAYESILMAIAVRSSVVVFLVTASEHKDFEITVKGMLQFGGGHPSMHWRWPYHLHGRSLRCCP